MNGNKFATGQTLEKPVEVVKGRILAGWAQESPKPWLKFSTHYKDQELLLQEVDLGHQIY
jgi:hypothetical protein